MNRTRPVWLRPAPLIGRIMKIHLYPDCRLLNDIDYEDVRRKTFGEALDEGRAVCYFRNKRFERGGRPR